MRDEIISEWVDDIREQIDTQTMYLVSGSAASIEEYTGVVGLIRGLNQSLVTLEDIVAEHKKEQGDN